MIWASSTNPVAALSAIASSVIGDWWVPLTFICGILFTIMVVGILVKNAGGEAVDFGLDDDELNPLE